MKKIFLCCLFLIQNWAYSQVLPQTGDSASTMLLSNMAIQFECTEGVNDLYNFKFERAASQFRFLRQRHKNHPLPYFLLGLNEWWKIVPNIENKKYDADFLAFMDTSIQQAEELYEQNEKNVEAAFFLAAAHGFKGRLYAERRNWGKATVEGKRALKFMEIASNKNELSPELLFGDGLYNYYSIWVPENYPMLKPVLWFFKKGDKEKGLKQLEQVVSEAFYTRTEAQYFLMRIYSNDENQPEKALQIASYLHKLYPDNAYFHRYYARMLFTLGRLYELEPVAQSILQKIDKNMPGYEEISGRYASFYLGYLYRVWRINVPLARENYEKAVNFSEKIKDTEAGYYLYSMLYLGQMHQHQQEYLKAKYYYEKIIAKAPRKHETKAEAEKYLKEVKKLMKKKK